MDGSYLNYQVSDGSLHIISMPERQTFEVGAFSGDAVSQMRWLKNNMFAFSTSEATTGTGSLYLYDPAQQSLEALITDIDYIHYFDFSSDLAYIALMTGSQLMIVDVKTHHITVNILWELTESGSPEWYNRLLWHPTEDWLLIWNTEGRSRIRVINTDGSIDRELTQCAFSLTCFGWLPDAR